MNFYFLFIFAMMIMNANSTQFYKSELNMKNSGINIKLNLLSNLV